MSHSQHPSSHPPGGVSRQKRIWLPVGIAAGVLVLGGLSFGLRSMFGDLAQVASGSTYAVDSAADNHTIKTQELRQRIQQRRSEFDALIGRMVPIAAGSFDMGNDDDENNERPVHHVQVRAFELDESEVTVAAWQKCMSQGKCASPAVDGQCNFARPERQSHPINCVTWFQAKAFCEWAVKRLPTEEEWEYVARGTDRRLYVWGNEEPNQQLCWRKGPADNPAGGTCLSTDFESGNSLSGVRDLAGNLSEWTSSAFCPYSRKNCDASSKVIRGASWSESQPSNLRPTRRRPVSPDSQNATTGFRCARDVI